MRMTAKPAAIAVKKMALKMVLTPENLNAACPS
jgi:hypothetical protein